jgi:sulfane dehydrogenase subunit SoxC
MGSIMRNAKDRTRQNRRNFLVSAALGGALAGRSAQAQQAGTESSALGAPASKSGQRSPYEKAERVPLGPPNSAAVSLTPLAETFGRITPASLHFERHHAGIPNIDPTQHRLMIHGLVNRPMIFSVDDIHRLPSVSRIHFLECAGNSFTEWAPRTAGDVQHSYGMVSGTEWTGVPLRLLLEQAGVRPEARWFIAEGADACHMARSVPIEKAMDDALVAYGQNGEALRPAQGYPLRLLLPGFEGVTNVKWLRRIQLTTEPAYTRDETSHYTETLPDGKSWIFAFPMDAKSVITNPSGGQKLPGPGFHEIRGLAWSGRGLVRRVEISTNGGATWADATLQQPVLPKALTPFQMAWRWDGSPAALVSRVTDETGYVQPSRAELMKTHGPNFGFHFNGQKIWRIAADGSITSEGAA